MKIFYTLLFFLFLAPVGGSEWKRVYLASYPRSGNHWTRYLIEEATHIATGSVYLDKVPLHLPDPFPWGGYSAKNGYCGNCRHPEKGDMVVIKTHYPAVLPASPFDFQPHKLTIRVVRNPLDAFYAQHVRDRHPDVPKEIPSDALKQYIEDWYNFQTYWNSQPNVLTIRYEDLYQRPRSTLKKILKAIGYRICKGDIDRAVRMYPPEEDPIKKEQYFSKSNVDEINAGLKKLLAQFNYEIN